jgi:hypothetical protein
VNKSNNKYSAKELEKTDILETGCFEKTSKKIKNNFCRGTCDAKLLLCALQEQDIILLQKKAAL